MLYQKYKLLFIIVICSLSLHNAGAALKTVFMDELCRVFNTSTYSLRLVKTGILTVVPSDEDLNCTVTLRPALGSSVVLSVFYYKLLSNDSLTIEDENRYKIALIDNGRFQNEEMSFTATGNMTIHFVRRSTSISWYPPKRSFQFTFTAVSNSPCRYSEFQCRNLKCIDKDLVCDGHNHCGDNSDQTKCVPINDRIVPTIQVTGLNEHEIRRKSLIWIISLSVAGGLVFIITMVLAGFLFRRYRRKKEQGPELGANGLQRAVSQRPNQQPLQLSANNLQNQAPPSGGTVSTLYSQSIFDRMRISLRIHSPKVEETSKENNINESFQVPSMYPNLDQVPTAPEMDVVKSYNVKVNE